MNLRVIGRGDLAVDQEVFVFVRRPVEKSVEGMCNFWNLTAVKEVRDAISGVICVDSVCFGPASYVERLRPFFDFNIDDLDKNKVRSTFIAIASSNFHATTPHGTINLRAFAMTLISDF